MTQKIVILFLSSNPLSTGRILVDEEAREVFERINEGPYRDRFELHVHTGIKPQDLQKLLLTYQPQIVHFSGHGSKEKKIILWYRFVMKTQKLTQSGPASAYQQKQNGSLPHVVERPAIYMHGAMN